MDGTSLFSLLMLLGIIAAGNGGGDVISLIPAKEYFKAREIEPTIDKLMALAIEPPTTGKKQIGQLIALRQLAADPKLVKDSPKVNDIRLILQQIAKGKRANDPAGFAAAYARQALAAIDGGKLEAPAVAGWKESAAWIPGNVTFLAGFDSRDALHRRKASTTLLLAIYSDQISKEALLNTAESLGNVWIDGLVFGLRELPKDELEYFIRVTGKFNSKWFLAVLKAAKVAEHIPKDWVNVHVVRPLYPNGNGAALALIGDSDILVAGNESATQRLGPGQLDKPADATSLAKMLALVAKPGKNATQGALKNDLAKVPATASGLAVGKIPGGFHNGATLPVPTRLIAHFRRTAAGIQFQAQGTLANADAARKLVEKIQQHRKKRLTELDKIKGQPIRRIPGFKLESMVDLLKSMEAQAEGNVVHIRLVASLEALMILPYFFD